MSADTIIAGGHTPESDWDGALSAIEERAELESLEWLQHQRRQLLPEYAKLKALHGSFGKFDFLRKAMLEACKIKARMELQKAGEKITESSVDAYGHADSQYLAYIDDGIAGAVRYIELETQILEIEEKVRNRELAMTAYSRELALR